MAKQQLMLVSHVAFHRIEDGQVAETVIVDAGEHRPAWIEAILADGAHGHLFAPDQEIARAKYLLAHPRGQRQRPNVAEPEFLGGDFADPDNPDPEPETPTQGDEGDDLSNAREDLGIPAQAGPAGTKKAWLDYAALNDVQVSEEMGRTELIEAVQAAGVPIK